MKKKIYTAYENNRVFFWMLAGIFVINTIYLSQATANVPIMDYWNYIATLNEDLFLYAPSLKQLYLLNGQHHTPLQLLFWVMNVKLFDWNVLVAIYLGEILMAVNAVLLYRNFKKGLSSQLSEARRRTYLLVGSAGILLALFGLTQWENITQEFYFPRSVQNAVTIFLLVYLNHLLRKGVGNHRKVQFAEYGVCCFCVILALYGGFFPIIMGVVICTMLLHFILAFQRERYQQVPGYFIVFGFIAAGTVFYLATAEPGAYGNASILSAFLDGSFVKGLLLMLGGSLLHTDLSILAHYIVGVVLFCAYLWAAFLYFNKKIYQKTYLPIMLMAYTAGTCLVITYGRIGRSISFLISSRYACDTTFGIIGMFWIFAEVLACRKTDEEIGSTATSKKKKRIQLCTKGACVAILLFVCSMWTWTYTTEWKVAPYRKEYNKNLIQVMIQADENTPDEQLVAFQAKTTNNVRVGIELMKKYQLGVFHAQPQNVRGR